MQAAPTRNVSPFWAGGAPLSEGGRAGWDTKSAELGQGDLLHGPAQLVCVRPPEIF